LEALVSLESRRKMLNIRRERFAQNVVSGSSLAAAYVAAGYKKAGANANAARLMRDDSVSSRINELRNASAASFLQLAVTDREQRLLVKGRVKGSHLGGAKGYHWGGAVLFCSRRDEPRRWESGKPAFGFPLFHPPSSPELWECGNLAVFWRDSQGARGKSGKPVFGFPCFPQPRHFHGSSSFG